MRPADRWLLRDPTAQAEGVVFCFPFAGTGASLLRRWPQRLGNVDICRVQLPGRENRIRQECFTTVEELADRTAAALVPHLDRPYALFGHCMGALLAHAVAARLEEIGGPAPSCLFVSSSKVPHLPPEVRYRMPAENATGIYHPTMSDAQLAVEMQQVASSLGDGQILPELLPIAIRVLRRDLTMVFRYRLPAPRAVSCPIVAIGWTDDPDVQPGEMAAWHRYGTVDNHVLTGDKLSFLQAPPALLNIIQRYSTSGQTNRPN